MEMPFAAVLAPAKLTGNGRDALNDWADGRAQSIAADNEIAANIQDPGTMPASALLPDSFTYFPMLGVPSYTSSLSGVGSLGLYGGSSVYPGFYSIYLPGYTRPPSFPGLRGIGRLGSFGGFGVPHSPTPPSRVLAPISPVRSPSTHPTPVHPAPHGGMHIGGHR
jgi:hypothetical protein